MIKMSSFVFLCLFVLTGCFAKSGIPVVGLDEYGNDVEEYISHSSFKKDMKYLLWAVSDSTLKAASQTQYKSDWEVEALSVGLGVNVDFNVKHLVSMQSSGRLRFIFSKDPTPLVPGN